MHGANFFYFGAGQRKKIRGGAGQEVKSSGRGNMSIQGIFGAGWGGAVLKIFTARGAIFPRVGVGRGVHP